MQTGSQAKAETNKTRLTDGGASFFISWNYFALFLYSWNSANNCTH